MNRCMCKKAFSSPGRNEQRILDLEAVYLKALELRSFEIGQLVQRNNFFMIFQGVLLAGILQSEGKIPEVSMLVSAAGIAMSYAQARMAAGAKYWQVRWEVEVSDTEEQLRNAYAASGREWSRSFFEAVETKEKVELGIRSPDLLSRLFINDMIMEKPSVSRLPIGAGLLLTFFWTAIWAVFLCRMF